MLLRTDYELVPSDGARWVRKLFGALCGLGCFGVVNVRIARQRSGRRRFFLERWCAADQLDTCLRNTSAENESEC